jgi:hypothetical protein
MVVVLVQEGRLFVGADDLDFKVTDVTFEMKVLNKYDTFDQISNRTKILSYAYLHYDFLDMVTLDHGHFANEINPY